MFINGAFFVAYFMLSIKLPDNKCLTKFVVTIFVMVRIFLFLFMFYFIFRFYELMILAIMFIINNKVTLADSHGKFNLVVAYIIVVVCAIILVLNVIVVLSIPCLIKRSVDQNTHRDSASHVEGIVTSFCGLLFKKIKDFIYPEVVNTDIQD